MNEKILLRFGVLILVIVLCTAMILGLYFGADSVNDAKVSSSLKGRDGSEIYSTSIYDVCSLSAMPYANYTADEFLIPKSEISGTPVNLREQNDFASKGTFVFVIRNLDPFDPDFSTKASVLNDKFLQGDGSWHLTFFIPQVWSSCNVYVNYVLESRVGDISDYQFSNYTDYYMSTVAHKTKTEPLFIDLTFYPHRKRYGGLLCYRKRSQPVCGALRHRCHRQRGFRLCVPVETLAFLFAMPFDFVGRIYCSSDIIFACQCSLLSLFSASTQDNRTGFDIHGCIFVAETENKKQNCLVGDYGGFRNFRNNRMFLSNTSFRTGYI